MGIPKRTLIPLFFLLLIVSVYLFRAEIHSSLRSGLVVSDNPDPADAIYVLAGTPELEARTERAADLYRKGLAPLVIFIKDNTQGPWEPGFNRNLTFAERSKVVLASYGVPESAMAPLTAEKKAYAGGTYEEAIAARKFIQDRNIRSLILVTSPLHTRRARRTFRELTDDLSIRVLVVSADPSVLDEPDAFSQKTGLEPPIEGRIRYSGLKNIFLEYVKTAYYAARFGLRKLNK